MTSSALMSIGMRAMFADYASMQTTGHNIANANTPGYSRQTVDVATAGGQYTGAGFFGRGVDVTTVKRASDQFLTMQSQAAASMAAMDDTRSTQLQQLQNVFPLGDTGMGASMGNFLNAYVDLANNPDDASARQVILADASEVASRFSSASSQIDTLQAGVTGDLKNSVSEVNTLAQQVAALNNQIAGFNATGQPPNDLLDQRDQLIKQIGGYVKVTTIPAADGTLGVFIAGGQRLVLGNDASQLQVGADPSDPSRSALSIVDSGVARPLSPDLLVGGSITGLLAYQNNDLVAARNQLGQMASAFAARVNDVQAMGIDLNSRIGGGGPIFSTGAPQAIPNANNARTAGGAFASTASITVTDATQLRASDYSLKADPSTPGSYIVTRLSDNQQFSMAPDAANPGQYLYTKLGTPPQTLGNSMDGFQVSLSGAPPTTTDSFLLQPVGHAANGMACALGDPNGLTAAAPLTVTPATTNTGTGAVSSVSITSPAPSPLPSTDITFTSGTNYTYTITDSTGAVTTGTGTWTAGTPIAPPGSGFQMQLSGAPNSGDTFSLTPSHPESNNANAQAMVALRDETMVGRSQNPDGTIAAGETVTDAYASTLANIGVRVQSAQTAASISAAASTQADSALSSSTGVNLDEEAGRLIQYQQGYQAAAKVLQVAQAVFDTMLQTVNAS
jgi:flagellar hook-associated protein 1 FlgK